MQHSMIQLPFEAAQLLLGQAATAVASMHGQLFVQEEKLRAYTGGSKAQRHSPNTAQKCDSQARWKQRIWGADKLRGRSRHALPSASIGMACQLPQQAAPAAAAAVGVVGPLPAAGARWEAAAAVCTTPSPPFIVMRLAWVQRHSARLLLAEARDLLEGHSVTLAWPHSRPLAPFRQLQRAGGWQKPQATHT